MMKLLATSLVALLLSPADAAVDVRSLFSKFTKSDGAAAAVEAADTDGSERALQANCNSGTGTRKWHPTYAAGWDQGYCQYTIDCNSPSYGSQLACCKGAYRGQVSGYCLSTLPSPPTTAPTDEGGLDVYYPDYTRQWPEGKCINDRPLPSGRPTYTSMLACCKGAYAGQMSGFCLSELPSPPTGSPTNSAFEADFFYPQYELSWDAAGCSNKLPLPYNNVNDRPNYSTQLACCKGAYGGQMSGVCLAQLPSPPTMAPTGTGGYDFYYPDYETPWTDAGCKNSRPLPFLPGGRPTYSTMLACCKGAYGGQLSGACLSRLPNPPTASPTESGGLDVFYPNYGTQYQYATCINDRPLPSGRPTYPTEAGCCSAAYGSQQSQACMCAAQGVCYSCLCGNDADRAAAGGCPGLDCSR